MNQEKKKVRRCWRHDGRLLLQTPYSPPRRGQPLARREPTPHITFFASAFFLIFIAGCASGGITPENVRTGAKGVEARFSSVDGLRDLFPGQDFQLPVEITNNGASDVPHGYFHIGLEKDVFETTAPAVGVFNIPGRSVANPIPRAQTVRIPFTVRELPEQSQGIQSRITFTLCYPYDTVATLPVCIDPDIDNKETQKPCKPQPASFSGQGGPLAITSVVPRMLSHNDRDRILPEFRITVANRGQGLVVAPERVQAFCSGGTVEPNYLNTAIVRVFIDEDKELRCIPAVPDTVGKDISKNAGWLRLENKQDELTCRLEEGISKSRGTYSTVLTATIDYGYTQTITTDAVVKR